MTSEGSVQRNVVTKHPQKSRQSWISSQLWQMRCAGVYAFPGAPMSGLSVLTVNVGADHKHELCVSDQGYSCEACDLHGLFVHRLPLQGSTQVPVGCCLYEALPAVFPGGFS